LASDESRATSDEIPLTFAFFSGTLFGQKQKDRERRLNMLLMSATAWIVIGVAAVILAVFIGKKIKDKYF
jgi:hypothetical protein